MTHFELLKYAATGIASPGMTAYDKMRAVAMAGGKVKTRTGVPPLSFKSNGKPLISWSMLGNGVQNGTPAPDAPIMPDFVGERTGNLAPPMDIWLNGYVNASGQISAQSTTRLEKTSPLIRVDDSLTYSYSYGSNSGYFPEGDENVAWRAIACYDTDGVFLSRIGGDGRHTIITTGENALPTGAAFIRLTLRTYGNNANCMLNPDSIALPYEPYGYKIPITSAGQTVPIYLGQVQTVRKIKKVMLTGNENWTLRSAGTGVFYIAITNYLKIKNAATCICSHYPAQANVNSWNDVVDKKVTFYAGGEASKLLYIRDTDFVSAGAFKQFLSDQYAAGTPVRIWYALSGTEIAIINEPLCKIGTYADTLDSADAGITIPTAKGANTLTVDTELQPSEMTITYR
jgi:hypothetical protein